MSFVLRHHFKSKHGDSLSGFSIHPLRLSAFLTSLYGPLIMNTFWFGSTRFFFFHSLKSVICKKVLLPLRFRSIKFWKAVSSVAFISLTTGFGSAGAVTAAYGFTKSAGLTRLRLVVCNGGACGIVGAGRVQGFWWITGEGGTEVAADLGSSVIQVTTFSLSSLTELSRLNSSTLFLTYSLACCCALRSLSFSLFSCSSNFFILNFASAIAFSWRSRILVSRSFLAATCTSSTVSFFSSKISHSCGFRAVKPRSTFWTCEVRWGELKFESRAFVNGFFCWVTLWRLISDCWMTGPLSSKYFDLIFDSSPRICFLSYCFYSSLAYLRAAISASLFAFWSLRSFRSFAFRSWNTC